MNTLKKLVSRFLPTPRVALVGSDLAGNKYYESPPIRPGYRPRRHVGQNAARGLAPTHYDPEQIPVQWQAWLRHTRVDAPTLDELQGDLDRQQRLRERVRALEARERASLDSAASSGLQEHASLGSTSEDAFEPEPWSPSRSGGSSTVRP